MIDPNKWFAFTWQEKEDCFQSQYTCTEDLPYLDGHFPDQPVMPAVAIIDATLLGVRSLTSVSDVDQLVSAKFSGPVTPGMKVTLQARQLPNEQWSVTWSNESQRLAELRLICTNS